jgi:molybdate transport repressor ModE-like protein
MRRILGQPIVEAKRGGEFGGGARLTEAGLSLLNEYYELEKRVRESVEGSLAGAERRGVIRRRISLMRRRVNTTRPSCEDTG